MPAELIQPTPYHPDDEPLICIRLNAFWIPYLIGALKPMRFRDYWTGESDAVTQAMRDSDTLVYQLETFVECGDDPMTVNYCCVERIVEHRINPTTLQSEISIDGGTTWTKDPAGLDATLTALPPPVTAGVMQDKCDAATNGQQHIEDIIQQTHNDFANAQSVGEFVIAIGEALLAIALYFAGPIGIAVAATGLLAAIYAAFTGLFSLGINAFDAYWTSVERDKILCNLYCNLSDDGSFTQAGFNSFLAAWKGDATPSLAFDAIYTSVKALGLKGMNNLCAYGNVGEGDCSSCECGCDPAIWQIGNVPGFNVTGTIDEVGADYIVASTAPLDGFHYLTLITGGQNECCCVTEFEMISGSLPSGNKIGCGNEQIEANIVGEPLTCLEAGQVSYLAWQSSSPFTVKIHFG